MNPTNSSKQTKLCPTCGTQLAENAKRCLVCGSDFTVEKRPLKSIQGSRMPVIRISLPIALGLLILILAVGASAVYFFLNAGDRLVIPTPISTPTNTATITLTPTETPIPSLTPTPTLLAPLEYIVKANDYCGSIAFAFDVSVQSIILLNNLSATCTDLVVGQKLFIPQPTPTPLPVATNTLIAADATRAACQIVTITVQSTDTLSSIALNYGVKMDAIKEWNGLSTDNVYLNQPLDIPLCLRAATPGPSPTPTLPAPYPAPNLLLPVNGSVFNLANDIVTLQWASIGNLRSNEAYLVIVEDVTEGLGRKLNNYVTDTKFIIPVSFRPQDSQPHIMSWQVVTVRQTGTDDQGKTIWSQAGTPSQLRVFIWSGAAPAITATP